MKLLPTLTIISPVQAAQFSDQVLSHFLRSQGPSSHQNQVIAASSAYSHFDFGESVQVESQNGWSCDGSIATRSVFVHYADDPIGADTSVIKFCVVFHGRTNLISEVYATDSMGDDIGYPDNYIKSQINNNVSNFKVQQEKLTKVMQLREFDNCYANYLDFSAYVIDDKKTYGDKKYGYRLTLVVDDLTSQKNPTMVTGNCEYQIYANTESQGWRVEEVDAEIIQQVEKAVNELVNRFRTCGIFVRSATRQK